MRARCLSPPLQSQVREIEELEHEALASRACLQCLPREVARLQVPPELITVVRTMDCLAVPYALHEQVRVRA